MAIFNEAERAMTDEDLDEERAASTLEGELARRAAMLNPDHIEQDDYEWATMTGEYAGFRARYEVAQQQQHDEHEENEVRPTLLGRLALAVDLLERAAKMIGVPTTQEELDAYIEAKRRYDDVESSFQETKPAPFFTPDDFFSAEGQARLAKTYGEKEAEAEYSEQWINYCNGW